MNRHSSQCAHDRHHDSWHNQFSNHQEHHPRMPSGHEHGRHGGEDGPSHKSYDPWRHAGSGDGKMQDEPIHSARGMHDQPSSLGHGGMQDQPSCHGRGGMHNPNDGHGSTHPYDEAQGRDLGHFPEFGGHLDELLFAHLVGSALPAGAGGAPITIVPIDHFEVNFYNVVQNTLTENTNVLFDASNGGSIGVGGAVSALSAQTSLLNNAPSLPDPHQLAPPDPHHFG